MRSSRSRRRAIERARAGDGPSLVEAVTYRHGGHSRADPGKYRPDDEVAAWKARDPLPDLPRPARGGRRAGRPSSTRSRPRRATRWPPPRPRRGPPPSRRRTSSRPRSGPTGAPRGGTDVSRGHRQGHRPGDAARSERGAHRRGRRGGRRRVQADRGPVRRVRAASACATPRSASRPSWVRRWARR